MSAYSDFKGPGGEAGFNGCVLFSCDEDAETLSASDPDAAVEEYLDGQYPHPLTGTVTVYGYTRRVVDASDIDDEGLLEDVLERLDEEYGDPARETKPTLGMRQAAAAFAEAIRSEYRVWSCDGTHSAVVDVAAWVRENAPEWLSAEPGR